MRRPVILLSLAGLCALSAGFTLTPALAGGRTTTSTVTVTGGHTTKAVDKGRPVVLVAATLGVPEAVFRDAFSRVTPAAAGTEPDPAQVLRNKAALLATLAPYGVTNDALDAASNHYRYDGSAGQHWPTTAAVVKVTISGGAPKVTVVRAGSGYTSAPTLTVPGHPSIHLKATLAFSRSFATNGRIASVAVLSR